MRHQILNLFGTLLILHLVIWSSKDFKLILLQRLVTLMDLVVFPLFFISSNNTLSSLVILFSSLLTSSLLATSPLLLSVTLFSWYLKSLYWSFVLSSCPFNFLPKVEYSNLLIVAAFSNSSVSGKISSLVKN